MKRTTLLLALGLALPGCKSDKATPAPATPTPQGPKAVAETGAPAAPAPAAAAPAATPQEIDARGMTELLAAHRGQPVLVNVFATWCEPCRRELPALDKLRRAHPKAYVVGVAVDERDAMAKLREFVAGTVPKDLPVRWSPAGTSPLLPSLKLPQDWYDAMPKGWDKKVPLSFVFNAAGEFENGSVGEVSPEALAAFDEILGGGGGAAPAAK